MHFDQTFQLEFEPDQEEHQDDAELGEVQRRLDIADELEAPRADQPTGNQVAQHRAEAAAFGERHADDGRREVNKGTA